MEIEREINNNIKIDKNKFLNSIMGKTINNAIDVGLKSILPDLIEEQVIDIKNSLMENGLKSGIETAVESAIDFGKSTIGIFTGNFENMTQVRIAIADGGIIDSMSNLLDSVVNKAYQKGYIDRSVTAIIKNGKNVLVENITSNIGNKLEEQTNAIDKLSRYVENWKEYYNNKNFEGMKKEYNKIREKLKIVIPVENILKETRKIEVLHNLIKNNGQNFQITELENQLVEKMTI